MRILFFNEGNLGANVMGQAQLEAVLRRGMGDGTDVEARFARLTRMGRLAHLGATWTTPALRRADLDLRTLRWHAIQALRARRALEQELRGWLADVVHVHSHSVALAMGRLMRERPFALSVDVTVRDWWDMPAWRRGLPHSPTTIAPSVALERRAFCRAALVLAWTATVQRSVERVAPGARVIEHHPGIDLERYRPALRRPRERPRVLFVGGRFAAKGGEDLIDALGDGLGRDVELDLVTPEDVGSRPGVHVHRLGPTDAKLLDLQQQADVFCLPTHADAVPWAILEAMACGTPVVSTALGSIPDLLDGGRCGVLVEHGRPRELGGALRELLADPERRRELAARARGRCEQRYEARRQSSRLIELLSDLSFGRR